MPTPPKPTPARIKKYLAKFETLDNYRLQESSLNLLFQELCPNNKKIEHVLLKVSALNDFYSTNIFGTYAVARHILKLGIDARLKSGNCDYSLVNQLASVKLKGKTKTFYSFASKYCSHHKPKTYPICDSFVVRMLMHYKSKDGFERFTRSDLKDYKTFVNVIKTFIEWYGLEKFSLRDIDIFLWMTGKQYFPKNYKSSTRVARSKARRTRARKTELRKAE